MEPSDQCLDGADVGICCNEFPVPHRKDICRARRHRAIRRHFRQRDRLKLERHGHVGSAPFRIAAPFRQIDGELRAGDLATAVSGLDAQDLQPKSVDQW